MMTLLLLLVLLTPPQPPTLTATWDRDTLVLTVVSDAPVVFVCPADSTGRCDGGGYRIEGGSGSVRIPGWATRERYVAEAWGAEGFQGASEVVSGRFRVWLPVMQ